MTKALELRLVRQDRSGLSREDDARAMPNQGDHTIAYADGVGRCDGWIQVTDVLLLRPS
jgi:hypothetical protein